MEACVDKASIFVLFASPHSIQSCWVKFEMDRARLAQIRRANFKVLVFPLSPDVTQAMLPAWMRNYWIPKAGYGPRDIARYIRTVLSSPPIAPASLSVPIIGRGHLLDTATQYLMEAVARTQQSPNVFSFAGIAGIGRRTFSRFFVEQAFPALPNLKYGPELNLPQFADLADLYRGLREHIESSLLFSDFEKSSAIFREMSIEDQVVEVVNSLRYFADLGQAVFVITGSGLFEDAGDPKVWVNLLFKVLSVEKEIRLCLVSNRQLRAEDLRHWINVLQIYVPPLKDPDIRALMTATSTAFAMDAIYPSDPLIRSIRGHAQIAKAAVRLISQKGVQFFERDPLPLFSIQDEILSENLEVGLLDDTQQEILCILSWVPQLFGALIQNILRTHISLATADFTKALDNLILGCLVHVTESNYMISPAIRQMFRR